MEHPHVAEAAVVGFPHDVKGEGVYAFVIPKQVEEDEISYVAHITFFDFIASFLNIKALLNLIFINVVLDMVPLIHISLVFF